MGRISARTREGRRRKLQLAWEAPAQYGNDGPSRHDVNGVLELLQREMVAGGHGVATASAGEGGAHRYW
jgi:hypothetical protein